ncbi:MAG: hypothetical protein EA376_08960 [Phycisphaeraceae bacterium]|nr:MAG: hypothetical protein EA376_08960 [Phycisphaeraceae bacterium]
MNVFYGVDISGTNSMPLPKKMRVNSNMASNNFMAHLATNNLIPSTTSFELEEGFDYLPWDQSPGDNLKHPAVDPMIQFGAGVTAQIGSASGEFPFGGVVRRFGGIETDPPGNPQGRYPASGDQYLSSGTRILRIDFGDTPITSFGFFGIDVGDFGATLTITLANPDENGEVVKKEFKIPPESQAGEATGSVMFWGIVANENPFSSITFGSDVDPVTGDTFAFDDFTIGIIPLPNAFGLGTMGLVCLTGASAFRRRRIS